MTKYVIVTAVSSYRVRYCIPVDQLQLLNTSVPVEGHEIEWAEDCVTCEEAEEFSQKWIGETIIDSQLISEEQMLQMFDADNAYLQGWSDQLKIDHVNRWKRK